VDCWRPGTSLEVVEQSVRDESCPLGVHMPVPVHSLLMRKEPLRNDHVQMILGARHGDVQKATLFLDLKRASRRQI
jgi:hypothetical protein